MTPLPGGFHLDYRFLALAKALLAMAALALLLWDLKFGSRGSGRFKRSRDVALGCLGILSLAAWWNFGALHGPGRPLHLHDFFHYYVGSKYFPELGYARIYQCVAVEEIQQGRFREVAQRWTRNLTTNDLERRVPDESETADCLQRFGPERWRAFSSDVEWFRGHMTAPQWAEIQMVFGHNATPAWDAIGYQLTRHAAASTRQILLLAAFDPVLLAVMWLVVWRTFGLAPACIAATWWGLNEVSGYQWIGGGFLRQDSLFCIVCGICAMRTGRRFLGGLSLGATTVVRAFPLFIVGGLAIKIAHVFYTRGFATTVRAYRDVVAGLLVAVSLVLAFAAVTWTTRGLEPLEPWRAFAQNSLKHLSTPITNHIGLKPVLWFSSDTRAVHMKQFWLDGPWDTWRAARTATFESRKPLYIAIALAFLALFAWNVSRLDDWMVVAFSVALLPFATTLANYYYSVFLVFGLMWALDKPIGVGLAALTFLTTVLPKLLPERDDRYFAISIAIVLYSYFVVVRARSLRPPFSADVAAVESTPIPQSVVS